MNFFKTAIAALALTTAIQTADAQQITCKGLTETECKSQEVVPGVSACTWISYATVSRMVEYCRTSQKKITKEQFEAIQARLNAATPADEQTVPAAQQPAN